MNTERTLETVDEGVFERLVIHYLGDTFPELRGLAITGLNAEGKAIPCPVDGVIYISDPEPCWVYVASTTTSLKSLRGKWLGTKRDVGDIPKAAKLFLRWQAEHQGVTGVKCRLYLATNRMLGGDADLYKDAVTKGISLGLNTKIVELSALLRYLDSTREGQYVRQDLLRVPANRLSLMLLGQIGQDSLKQHWQRYGPAWHGPHRLIPREAMKKVRSFLAGGSPLIGLQGISGGGKSMLAHQIAQEHIGADDVALWIPADKIVLNAPLATTLTGVLQSLSPSLEAESGQDVLRFVAEQSSRLILVVDDINRTGQSAALVQAIEGWVGSHLNTSRQTPGQGDATPPNVSFLVPLWPNEITQSGMKALTDHTSRAAWQYVTVERYSPEEQKMLAQSAEIYVPDFERLANALGGDPFLCGLITPFMGNSTDVARSELVRKLFEGFVFQAAQAAEAHARAEGLLVTTYDVVQAMDGLIDLILETSEPAPAWTSVRDRLSDRQADILHHSALTNQFGWLVSDTQQATWQWKHTRLRDALIGRRLAAIAFLGTEVGVLSDQVERLLSDPGLSEAWALSLVFLPNSAAQVHMIEVLGERAPLALAHALRLSLFPKEEEQRQALRREMKTALTDLSDRADEFVPGLHTLLLQQLSVTGDELVLDITEGLSDAWDVSIARVRNGDTEAALRMIEREQKYHYLLPSVGFRQIEDALKAFGECYSQRKQELLGQMQATTQQGPRSQAAILLMGYLAWPEFAPLICVSWQGRNEVGFSDEGREHRTWLYHLWSLGRSCTPDESPVLEELLVQVARLDDEHREHGATQRYKLFTQSMGRGSGLRWPISSAAAQSWVRVATENPEISLSLFYVCKHLEEPDIVEAYIRWYVTAKPFLGGEFSRNWDVLHDPQPLSQEGHHDAAIHQSEAVVGRLWKMVTQEAHQGVRELAFAIWKRSASCAELNLLRDIPEDDPLFTSALEVRVRLDDETAAPALAARVRQDPKQWCGYAPRLYRNNEVKQAFLDGYASALEQNKWEVASAIKHLPLDTISEFVQHLKPSLLKAHTTWVPLLLTDVKEALSLVQEALLQAEEKDLQYLFSFDLTQPMTEQMLEALRPALSRFEENKLNYLVEHAIKSGQGEWAMRYLPNVVSDKDHSRRWLTETDILKSLEELARRVPQGYMEVRCTSEYHDVIDMESRRNALQDPLKVIHKWLGEQPSDAQIIIAAMVLAERGTSSDLFWWSRVVPGDVSGRYWENALRLLKISRWND